MDVSDIYEEVQNDDTENVKTKVRNQVTLMQNNGEMIDTTKAFIETGEVHPGVYYENPKTHKFEENADLAMGFKSRGINSIKNTPTEKLGDYCDFIINPGMQKLPTFL